MKFFVERAKWLRGAGGSLGPGGGTMDTGESSCLLDARGHMCCLGFLAIACGAKPSDIEQVGTPEATPRGEWAWPAGIVKKYAYQIDLLDVRDSVTTKELMRINDQAGTDADREPALTRKFAELGIEVEFV